MLEILEKIKAAIISGESSVEITAKPHQKQQYKDFFYPRTKYFTSSITVRSWCDRTGAALVEWTGSIQPMREINAQIDSFKRVNQSIANGSARQPKCLYCGRDAYVGLFSVECECRKEWVK